MNILMISGSSRPESTNSKLLSSLHSLDGKVRFMLSEKINQLPLFKAELDVNPLPLYVREWREEVQNSDGVIICTPEYIHNMPALLKNALEWLTSSGELAGKRVLALTFTPNPPRGDKAMQSLCWSLKALDSNILASLSLYHADINFLNSSKMEGEGVELLKEAIALFY